MGLHPRTILLIGATGLVGCSASTGNVVLSKSPACEPAHVESCTSRCGPGTTPKQTREGGCETVVHDLCLAHCAEECGGGSADLAERIAALEARLDHECGSGRPAAPEEAPRATPQPTPNPLDRLLL